MYCKPVLDTISWYTDKRTKYRGNKELVSASFMDHPSEGTNFRAGRFNEQLTSSLTLNTEVPQVLF